MLNLKDHDLDFIPEELKEALNIRLSTTKVLDEKKRKQVNKYEQQINKSQ